MFTSLVLLLFLSTSLLTAAETHNLSEADISAIFEAERSRGDMAKFYAEQMKKAPNTKKIQKAAYLSAAADYKLRGKEPEDKNFKVMNPNASGTSAGGDIGFNIYQLIDALYNKQNSELIADSLDGTSPQEVVAGFEDTSESETAQFGPSPSKIANIVRPLTKLGYGISPFMNDITDTKYMRKKFGHSHFNKTTTPAKVFGAANLAALGADALYGLTHKKNDRLTAKEARLLSYLNRRKGTPQEISDYKAFMRRSSLLRLLITVLGQGAIPTLLAMRKDKTPVGYVGNAAGIADSLISMLQRYKKRKLIAAIKDIAPLIKQDLKMNQPTEAEIAADKNNMMPFDFDEIA